MVPHYLQNVTQCESQSLLGTEYYQLNDLKFRLTYFSSSNNLCQCWLLWFVCKKLLLLSTCHYPVTHLLISYDSLFIQCILQGWLNLSRDWVSQLPPPHLLPPQPLLFRNMSWYTAKFYSEWKIEWFQGSKYMKERLGQFSKEPQ